MDDALIIVLLLLLSFSSFGIFFLYLRYKKVKSQLEASELKIGYLKQKIDTSDTEKKEFIDIIMHELNTPLATTSGYLSMILEIGSQDMKPKIVELLKKSYESTQRMVKTTNDLMASSEVVTESNSQAFQFEEIIQQVVEKYEAQAKEKGLTLTVKPPKKIPLPMVVADPLSGKLVLANLVDNSLKFTTKGQIIIETEPKNSELEIKVSDTGLGIPENVKSRIFDKFFQVDLSHTREAGGTGVGLYNAKKMIEKQGGRIWFESKENKGSTFYFTLPLVN